MGKKFRFDEIEQYVRKRQPGLYEISTLSGVNLKVGISVNLLNRLKAHRASRNSGLKLKPGGSWDNPSDVLSKKSILAKHLFFDRAISSSYNLRTESGRREFLQQECVISVVLTKTKADAREIEKKREVSGDFRYVGKVVVKKSGSDC